MPEGAELQALDSSPVATPSHTRCHTRNVTPVTLRFDLEAVAQEFRNMGHDAPSSGLSDSPTQTPLHTRTGSKKGMIVRPHTVKEAGKFMADLEALVPGDHVSNSALNNPEPERTIAVNRGKVSDITTAFQRDGTSPEPVEKAVILVNVDDRSANIPGLTKVKYLAFYIGISVALTLSTKALLKEIPAPYAAKALQCWVGLCATITLYYGGSFKLKPITAKDDIHLYALSILHTANTAVSKISLAMIVVPFHQAIRATTPIFIITIYHSVLGQTYCPQIYLSLIPVALGLGLVIYGSDYITSAAFSIILLGAALAVIRTVATNRMQTSGLWFSAPELLFRVLPIACGQCLMLAYLTGELHGFKPPTMSEILSICTSWGVLPRVLNGFLAFGLDLASLIACKQAGALTLAVAAATVKQVFVVTFLAVSSDSMRGCITFCGLLLVLAGGMGYGMLQRIDKETFDGVVAV